MLIKNPNLLYDFREFTNSYLSRLDLKINKTQSKIERDQRKKQILEYSFGLKNKFYTTEELSYLLNQSTERIRQIKLQTLIELRREIFSPSEDLFPIRIFEEIINFKVELEKLHVISQNQFSNLINQSFKIDENINPFLNLFIEILDFKTIKVHLHLLKDNPLIFFDSNIDSKQFIKICYAVYITIEKQVIPIEFDDIIIGVRKYFKTQNIEQNEIELAIKSIDSCEEIIVNDTKLFQINFAKLSSYADMSYRILFEKKEPTKLIEIQREINNRLRQSKRIITNKQNFGAQLNGDKRFLPLGKTGVWTLAEWGEDNQTIYDLITNTLIQHNRSLSRKEIYDHIKKTRPYFIERSLFTYLYDSRYSVLNDKTFILSDWKELYKSKIVKTVLRNKGLISKENKVPEQIVDKVLNMFEENNTKELLLSTVVNVLSKKFKFPKNSIYGVISSAIQFETVEIDSYRKKIYLKNNTKNYTSQMKTTSVFISYSWESEPYKEKVISFVNFLRENGFNADMDIKLIQQESAIDFNRLMHKGITAYNKVIILLSESYKQKADNFEGGVGKEYRYISGDIEKNPKKYIFASFQNLTNHVINKITPLDFLGREIINLVNDEKGNFENLFSKLTESERYIFSDVAAQTPIIEKVKIQKFTLK